MQNSYRKRTRETLRRWAAHEREIRELKRRLDEMSDRAAQTLEALRRAQEMRAGGDCRAAEQLSRTLEGAAAADAVEAGRVRARLERLTREDALMLERIGRLSAGEREVVRLRYERRLTYVAIGIAMGISDRHARRLERRAADKIGGFKRGRSH